jgi:very-short-patch-repair endonuclease
VLDKNMPKGVYLHKLLTVKHKRKIGDAVRGEKNPNYGRRFSLKIRKRMSKGQIEKGNNVKEKNPNWRGGKIKRICRICNKEFLCRPSDIKRGWGRFCSHHCTAIFRNKNMKTRDTLIERLIEEELIRNRIIYIKQAPVEGIALVDFLLSNRIVIQCDGDYWHSLKENKNRDKRQDFILSNKGYKIYRFWEHEIKKSVKECIDKIVI